VEEAVRVQPNLCGGQVTGQRAVLMSKHHVPGHIGIERQAARGGRNGHHGGGFFHQSGCGISREVRRGQESRVAGPQRAAKRVAVGQFTGQEGQGMRAQGFIIPRFRRDGQDRRRDRVAVKRLHRQGFGSPGALI